MFQLIYHDIVAVEPLKCKSESGKVRGPDITCEKGQNACITKYIGECLQRPSVFVILKNSYPRQINDLIILQL